MKPALALPPLHGIKLSQATGDALVLVGPLPLAGVDLPPALRAAVDTVAAKDQGLGLGQVAVLPVEAAPGGRLLLVPTGDLAHWTDDVRRIGEAVLLGVRRAVGAGARRPVVAVQVPRDDARFAQAVLVAAAAAVQAAWSHPQWAAESAIEAIEFVVDDDALLARAAALEAGRALARDLTAGDPEVTAPEGFAQRCEMAFATGPVTVEVDRDADALVKANPLLGAVARASMQVERHRPRVIRLHYDGGAGPHYFFAGKGVTYDTGGADLKVGGSMRGMSGDKGGAAGVAGFFRMLSTAQPKGVRATAYLGCVRNSIGAEAYVSDEVITSRAGVPIVVGNTDAEGRMVLADMLAALRPEAAAAGDAVLFSVATLTGHVIRAYGHYASAMANGAAVAAGWPQRLVRAGDALGDPFEHSRIRREDYEMIAPQAAGAPVVQCNSAASVNTPRGHQFPFAFLERASGLDAHDVGAAAPLPFLHLDIAGAAEAASGPCVGLPTGAPVAALAGALLGYCD